MMDFREVLVWLALGILAGGLALAMVPPIGPSNLGLFLIAVSGLSALLFGLYTGMATWRSPRYESAPTETETLGTTPPPGYDINDLLEKATPPQVFLQEQRQLHRRTVNLVHKSLTLYEAYEPTEATKAITSGIWTDNTLAAGYLSGHVHEGSVVDRLAQRWRGEVPLREALRQTIIAVEELVPGVGSPDDSTEFSVTLRDPWSGISVSQSELVKTNHWYGISLVAFVGIGLGVGLEQASLLLVGAVGLAYTAYARLGGPPSVSVTTDRTVSIDQPTPGEHVDVTLTVQNDGDQLLPDVRIVDQLPEGVRLTDGQARRSVALRPGDSTQLHYTVEAVMGTHRFERTQVLARSLNGSYERSLSIPTETELTCTQVVQPVEAPVPLRGTAARFVGQLRTDTGGEGLEFQSVRDYRPGDRLSRIDWSRLARTDDLTTIDFHEEKAATIVMVIDAREIAYVSPSTDEPHAVQRSIEAATRLVVSLVDEGHRVGLTAMTPRESIWYAPSAARDTVMEIQQLLQHHPALELVRPTGEFGPFSWVEWFEARAPGSAQVILFSPMCDPLMEEAIIRIEAHGHPVTVLSPDPITTGSLGARMAALERQTTIDSLRRRGIHVVDWPAAESIDMSLERFGGV